MAGSIDSGCREPRACINDDITLATMALPSGPIVSFNVKRQDPLLDSKCASVLIVRLPVRTGRAGFTREDVEAGVEIDLDFGRHVISGK